MSEYENRIEDYSTKNVDKQNSLFIYDEDDPNDKDLPVKPRFV